METQSTPKTWKQKIIDYESRAYKSLSGIGIKVVNVRVRKDKIIADVKISQKDAETTYKKCVYIKEAL